MSTPVLKVCWSGRSWNKCEEFVQRASILSIARVVSKIPHCRAYQDGHDARDFVHERTTP